MGDGLPRPSGGFTASYLFQMPSEALGRGGNQAPRGGHQRGTPQAWVYSLMPRDLENAGNVVRGVTYSFVSQGLVKLCGAETQLLDAELEVVTPTGLIVVCSKVIIGYLVEIQGRMLPTNLIVFDMHRFDIILGKDWLASSSASIDCHRKEVVFRPPGEQEFKFVGLCVRSVPQILSAIQEKRLLRDGCQGHLAFVKKAPKEELKLEDIPVIREFSDVFLEDLLGLPLDHEVEFTIELTLGMTPISKAPYQMA
ncbi:uncharacterized protein LOC131148748 [Malania oleifera]|uniref:uncharacterized protein LOC131148748 n=1 Tax=Malania oleifera TaxID=397392 RepID=UPI0025AEB0A6|nr:uncharacterized protein LOC131148748 [Malania oleifera]